jgi:hypothetical protein
MTSRRQLSHVVLLATGVSVFLGLSILADLLGVLRHVEVPWMFGEWIELSPSAQESTVQWLAWGACLLIPISTMIVTLARTKMRPEPVVALTFLIFPSLSLLIVRVSPNVGATLLAASGFLVAYTVTSRSRALFGVDPGFARRLVCTVVFTLFALTAVGGVMCVLLWQAGAFFVSTSGISQVAMGMLLGMMTVDLKSSYLAQPMLAAIFLAAALAAVVALFREPMRWLAGTGVKSLTKERSTTDHVGAPRHESETHSSLAYLTLVAALGLGISVTVYRALQLDWTGGADFPWYVRNLRPIGSLTDAAAFLNGDRGLFLLLLSSIGTVMGVSPEEVVRFSPAMLSVLLALSTFLLVREGTGRLWVSSFAALLSVVSAQTTLGMYAGLLANWFALSIANFTFALIIRAIRLRSPFRAAAPIALSLVLLAGYAYVWVVAVVELLLALVGSIVAFRSGDANEWKYDVGILSGVVFGIVVIPLGLASVTATPLPDPSPWIALGWRYAQAARGEAIRSAMSTLEFSLAQGHIELPFLAMLSVLGLLDPAPRTPCFTRITGAMVLVPLAIELVPNAPSYFPLRGLYLIPLYMLGALGAESAIRRVNGGESVWKLRSTLAFTFTAYVILSQLGYTLRMFGLPLLPLP